MVVISVNDDVQPLCVKRILVPIDSSSHSFAALQAALTLASHYDAILKGIYVEDIALLNLADMPFHQEIGAYTAIVREISMNDIVKGISVQSKWVVTTFQKLINRAQLNGDIAVLRGKVFDIIKQEAENCDLLIIGKSGKNIYGKQRLGSTAKALIRKHQKTLLLVEEGNQIGYPLIIVFDPSPIGRICLETARDLLGSGETLVVLLDEDDPEVYQVNRTLLSRWASDTKINISIQNYTKNNLNQFLRMIKGLKNGLFILPHHKNTPKIEMIKICLEEVSLPILLIKPPQTS
jgi:nucleotide-binding universal stress UspA family protein